MSLYFFNHEVENPVLQVIIAIGAIVFAISIVALVMLIVLPVVGVVLTGGLLVTVVILLILLITLPFLAFFGILFSNRKKGSGIKESRTIDVEPFHSVKVSGAITADIVCGQTQMLTLTTDDNLLDEVKTTVKDGELSVSFARSILSNTGIEVQISMDELKKIRMYGAVKAAITGINSDELVIRGSGACKLTADGISRITDVNISGAGKFSAAELISRKMKIKISGCANAVVHAVEKVTVKISGAGKVVCHGNPPEVHKHISGAGKVEIVE